MLRRVARLSLTEAAASRREFFINTTSAASMAMSVPAPIAIPMSARVKAGASLMPSPTIAVFPDFCKSLMTLSFPSGSTPAITSSTPASWPIAFAVRSLSPVSITTLIPIDCNSLTACLLSGFMTSATAIIPTSSSFFTKRRGVFPSSANF